jgi:hypothetical protein
MRAFLYLHCFLYGLGRGSAFSWTVVNYINVAMSCKCSDELLHLPRPFLLKIRKDQRVRLSELESDAKREATNTSPVTGQLTFFGGFWIATLRKVLCYHCNLYQRPWSKASGSCVLDVGVVCDETSQIQIRIYVAGLCCDLNWCICNL